MTSEPAEAEGGDSDVDDSEDAWGNSDVDDASPAQFIFENIHGLPLLTNHRNEGAKVYQVGRGDGCAIRFKAMCLGKDIEGKRIPDIPCVAASIQVEANGTAKITGVKGVAKVFLPGQVEGTDLRAQDVYNLTEKTRIVFGCQERNDSTIVVKMVQPGLPDGTTEDRSS